MRFFSGKMLHLLDRILSINAYCLRAMMLLFVLICIVPAGCKEDPTIWSTESTSPDGSWFARAHTVQHSGPGADGVETLVDIKRKTGLKTTIRILAFSDDGASMSLKLIWATPSHLEVAFRDDPKVLYYQVVKTSGIDITVHNLSSGTTDVNQ